MIKFTDQSKLKTIDAWLVSAKALVRYNLGRNAARLVHPCYDQ